MASIYVHATISLILHYLLILYGEIHDKELGGQGPIYTDVDYRVVTDAAKHVLNGQSPYLRTTYRYTPLLAYLLTPNLFLCEHWGKFVFSISNVITGLLIGWILPSHQKIYALCWLYNPVSAIISTRGSYESIVTMIVLLLIYHIKRNNAKTWISGILLAFAVHMKIYPIIYSLALYFYIERNCSFNLTFRRFKFVSAFIGTTLILNGYFYHRYGYQFLYETYIYHIIRRDTRHNFSPYFYLSYLKPENSILPLITFVPQLINTLVCSYRLYDRLELCLFALTFAFVTFNKVSTSQYFIWYLIFLPILLPNVQLKTKHFLLMLIGWLAAQALWLYQAYLLEFQAKNTFVQIWLASIIFGFVNVFIICVIVSHYRSTNNLSEESALKKKNE